MKTLGETIQDTALILVRHGQSGINRMSAIAHLQPAELAAQVWEPWKDRLGEPISPMWRSPIIERFEDVVRSHDDGDPEYYTVNYGHTTAYVPKELAANGRL